MSKKELMANAIKASAAIKDKYRDGLPFFHLRPTSSGITLVTTHESDAMCMRGIARISPTRSVEMLNMSAEAVKNDGSVDWSNIVYKTKQGNSRRFPERKQQSINSKREKEFAIQAWLINKIVSGNDALSKTLGVSELYFLGSEIIWQESTIKNGQRLDIVAHDDKGKVLFLELKDISNKADNPEKQVKDYLETYSKDKYFKEFLLAYPSISAIGSKKIESFEGWVVIGDCNDLCINSLDVKLVK